MSEVESAFHFHGRIPASKSILNRLFILKSFEPSVKIVGDSHADDVLKMKSALAHFERGEMADCGAGGTTLRFVALRVSRRPGTHHLSGSLRLFERPQAELVRILEQLGCEAELGRQRLTIRSQGWKIPEAGVTIDRSISSQFASAILLSSWELDQPLTLKFTGSDGLHSYFALTLELAKRAGLRLLEETETKLTIAPGCKVQPGTFIAEPDLSSAFAIAGLAAVRGQAEFLDWPMMSLQPDGAFVGLLQLMGCRISVRAEPVAAGESGQTMNVLRIERPEGALRPVTCELRESPDLFPVLSVLCAFADGRSVLFGAPHFAHKESSRIEKSEELVRLLGRKCRKIEGGLEIDGEPPRSLEKPTHVIFDTDHDHRLAMAAGVARAAVHSIEKRNIEIRGLEAVNKSFPEFWATAADITGLTGASAR
jgi:3-phosphoshikimate 1-carboxyvinyltransferase